MDDLGQRLVDAATDAFDMGTWNFDTVVVDVLTALAEHQDWWIGTILSAIAAGGNTLAELPRYMALLGAVQGRVEVADELRGLAVSIKAARDADRAD